MNAELQKEGVAEFFRKKREKLIRYVHRWVEDTAERDAEDIVHDVMLNIFDKSDITASIENLSAYVYRSLYNRVIDGYRAMKHIHSLDACVRKDSGKTLMDLLEDVRYDQHTEMEKKQLRGRIFNAIDQLKPILKEVFIATELEGYSFRELASMWNVPMGTLLARKHRATKKIQSALKKYYEQEGETG